MINLETEKYLVRLLDKNNSKELLELQQLRYNYLLKYFNQDLDDNGIDDDGYDEYSDSILVIDKSTNKICGTYRVSTLKTLQGKPFKSEGEFIIDPIKNSGYGIVETGRAVVHSDYRDGVVIGLLWKGLFSYTKENNCKYIIGTVSFQGCDPTVFDKAFAYLRNNKLNTEFSIKAKCNSYEYPVLENNYTLKESGMPSLMKTYLEIGSTVSINGFVDKEFNSCDVMIIMDIDNLNQRFLKHFIR